MKDRQPLEHPDVAGSIPLELRAVSSLRVSYVAYRTDAELTVAGKLVTVQPDDGGVTERGPAVLICHGSDGVDGRGEFHAAALNAAGIATLEIDMWAARGTGRGAASRRVETGRERSQARAARAAGPGGRKKSGRERAVRLAPV